MLKFLKQIWKTLVGLLMKNKTSFWPKALLLPSDFYFTIIVACIVAFVPVAFQETISTIPSTTIVTNFFKIVLFLLFTGIVIFMGKNFIEFAMFAKYVSERVNKIRNVSKDH